MVPGTYTARISKSNHVTREVTLTATTQNVTFNTKICLTGDVTGDGVVDVGDVSRVYAHVQGKTKITDSYMLACANPDGGKLMILDVSLIYAHVTGVKPLF